jgi:hypothetical protein
MQCEIDHCSKPIYTCTVIFSRHSLSSPSFCNPSGIQKNNGAVQNKLNYASEGKRRDVGVCGLFMLLFFFFCLSLHFRVIPGGQSSTSTNTKRSRQNKNYKNKRRHGPNTKCGRTREPKPTVGCGGKRGRAQKWLRNRMIRLSNLPMMENWEGTVRVNTAAWAIFFFLICEEKGSRVIVTLTPADFEGVRSGKIGNGRQGLELPVVIIVMIKVFLFWPNLFDDSGFWRGQGSQQRNIERKLGRYWSWPKGMIRNEGMKVDVQWWQRAIPNKSTS